ncbi:XRE family transcriptional regulator [Lactobacillus helveticus]|nr:XRE family transcriptional regulator [Lactobacillus helveticus]
MKNLLTLMKNMKSRIKELRNKKHLTQKELGRKIKLAVSTISGYESG